MRREKRRERTKRKMGQTCIWRVRLLAKKGVQCSFSGLKRRGLPTLPISCYHALIPFSFPSLHALFLFSSFVLPSLLFPLSLLLARVHSDGGGVFEEPMKERSTPWEDREVRELEVFFLLCLTLGHLLTLLFSSFLLFLSFFLLLLSPSPFFLLLSPFLVFFLLLLFLFLSLKHTFLALSLFPLLSRPLAVDSLRRSICLCT